MVRSAMAANKFAMAALACAGLLLTLSWTPAAASSHDVDWFGVREITLESQPQNCHYGAFTICL